MIKIVIIDDSYYYSRNLRNLLDSSVEFKIVKILDIDKDILKNIAEISPDLLFVGSKVGKTDGISLIKKINEQNPIPIIFFSDFSPESYSDCLLSLQNGAIDFLLKPLQNLYPDWSLFREEIFTKIRIASKAKLSRFHEVRWAKVQKNINKRITGKIVVIASSTGGVQTLMKIVPSFPKIINSPIVIIQHMPQNFTREFANNLDRISEIKVKEASDGDILEDDIVYIGRGGYHLEFEEDAGKVRIRFDDKPAVWGLKPYANYTFTSAVSIYGKKTIGVVLTGMGQDGTDGVRDIRKSGGITVAQSVDECILWGMPKSAIDSGNIDFIVNLKDIPSKIVELVNEK